MRPTFSCNNPLPTLVLAIIWEQVLFEDFKIHYMPCTDKFYTFFCKSIFCKNAKLKMPKIKEHAKNKSEAEEGEELLFWIPLTLFNAASHIVLYMYKFVLNHFYLLLCFFFCRTG